MQKNYFKVTSILRQKWILQLWENYTLQMNTLQNFSIFCKNIQKSNFNRNGRICQKKSFFNNDRIWQSIFLHFFKQFVAILE